MLKLKNLVYQLVIKNISILCKASRSYTLASVFCGFYLYSIHYRFVAKHLNKQIKFNFLI